MRRLPTVLSPPLAIVLALALGAAWAAPGSAQQIPPGPEAQWRYYGGDAAHTRYAPLTQIDSTNFEDLEEAWIWQGGNWGPQPTHNSRSTPIYVDGTLYTVAGYRRTVVAIDPATGETLWTFREPNTIRWERSMRAAYGKSVSYGEIDGRGVIYISTPAFFLWALDAETGEPLEDWGRPVPLEGFPQTGVVDMLPDLLRDWGRWEEYIAAGGNYDPNYGIPRELGFITTSSPPIVVDGTVVVGNSHEQGYNQTRIENVPGDILGYDAETGDYKWKFHVIPRPGEVGHETWENDAWQWTGDVSSWAPMSADLDRGIVYIPTNPPTIDYWGGFRPGDGLFGTSVIALDADTGERVWHYQLVHHDVWNYDTPTAPILLDLTVDGEEIPALAQVTKQAMVYTFNRETGEPVWPIEEREVPQSDIPGEQLSPTQPFPTKPAPFEMQGLTEDDLVDFTPEIRQMAMENAQDFQLGPLFNPPVHEGNEQGYRGSAACPGGGGAANIWNPPVADPTTNILYVSTSRNCGSYFVVPGESIDRPDDIMTTGETIAEWAAGSGGALIGPQGLPIFKPPYSRIVAIDMNTGEHLWEVINGDTPDRIANHPLLEGVDVGNTGQMARPVPLVTGSLLIWAEGLGGRPLLHAADKTNGRHVGTIEMPGVGQYGMMSYEHEGEQYVIVQVGSRELPGSLVAYKLP